MTAYNYSRNHTWRQYTAFHRPDKQTSNHGLRAYWPVGAYSHPSHSTLKWPSRSVAALDNSFVLKFKLLLVASVAMNQAGLCTAQPTTLLRPLLLKAQWCSGYHTCLTSDTGGRRFDPGLSHVLLPWTTTCTYVRPALTSGSLVACAGVCNRLPHFSTRSH